MNEKSITKLQLKRILKIIEQRDLVAKWDLVDGNCGIFAICINRLLGDRGRYYGISHQGSDYEDMGYDADFQHVVLRIGHNVYCDGEGLHTKDELKERWKDNDPPQYFYPIDKEDEILKGTAPTLQTFHLMGKIRMLLPQSVRDRFNFEYKFMSELPEPI